MSAPTLHIIAARGLDHAVWEWPGDGPPLLFVHATGFHGRIWDQSIRALPDRHAYAVELRGHGRSGKPDPPYPWREFGLDLCAVAGALGITGAIGIGHSTGGHTLVTAALDRPALFAALLLVDATIFLPEFYGRHPGDFSFIERRRNVWSSPAEMIERFRDRSPFAGWDPAVLRDYCDFGLLPRDGELVLACPPAIEASVYGQANVPESDLHLRIPAVFCPVTVVRGGIPWVPGVFNLVASPTAPELASWFPNGRDLLLEGRTHYIPMESPGWIAEQIAAISDQAISDRTGQRGGCAPL